MAPNFEPHSSYISAEKKQNTKGSYKRYLDFEFGQPLVLSNIILLTLYHLGFLYAVFTYPWIRSWKTMLYAVVLSHFAGFGVTGGAHRLYTHRSYKASRPVQILLLILFAMSGHNNLYDWVRDHRVHHKFSETDADPHNAKRGFFFAHVGWLMMKKHPDVIAKGKLIDMSDLEKDPLLVWYNKHFSIIQLVCCFIIPTLVPPLGWGETWWNSILSQNFFRYIFILNMTWLVNSAAHLLGNKPYDTNINPRENWSVSVLGTGLGEGWHNFHHSFPWDYRASEYGKINLTTLYIDLFGKLGLTHDFRAASPALVKKVATKFGDGSHIIFGDSYQENGEVEFTNK